MKIYIKPWAEALKCAKESNVEYLTDTLNGIDLILGVSHRHGDWGEILEAKKGSNEEFDYYTTYYHGVESFVYPACCVVEITPECLEKYASKFSEEIITTNNTLNTWDRNLEDYEIHRITIYKAKDPLHSYFFYVKRISYNGLKEIVEDFREIN